MRKVSILLALVAGLFATPVYADFTAKDASAATITFKNPGVCSSVVCVPVFQLYDGTNVVTLTTAGADAASNTLTGVPVYGRNLVFNGTTWDRWTGAVTVTGVATASNQTSQITQETAINTVLGTQADAAWVSGSGTAVAILKNIAGGVAGSIPAGTALIGDVNVRQGGTALSTTNGLYSNLLQGNAVISATNGLYNNLLQGNAVISATNGIFANVLQGNAVLSATNPSFSRLTDGTNAQVTDPCQAVTKINFTGSQTTGTQIIAGTSAKKTYICSIQLIAQAAEIVNIIAGTGSVCATGSSAVMGSTTAANGMSYAANGGFTQGNGSATVISATAANADNVCITQSGSSRITYQIQYVQL